MTLDLADQVHQPDADAIRSEATRAGAVDPSGLRFRVLEFERETGRLLAMRAENIAFSDAVDKVNGLAPFCLDSHFLLEPVGFLQ